MKPTVQFNLKMPVAELRLMKGVAKKRGLSVAALVRELVAKENQRLEKKEASS